MGGPPRLLVGDTRLRLENEIKYLGVHVGERLVFGNHAMKLRDTVHSRFFKLRSIAMNTWGITDKCRTTYYKALFLPIVTYAAPAWSEGLTKSAKAYLLQEELY